VVHGPEKAVLSRNHLSLYRFLQFIFRASRDYQVRSIAGSPSANIHGTSTDHPTIVTDRVNIKRIIMLMPTPFC
jgi:hypothetical protein